MTNLIEPEGQTTSDNFDVSANKSENAPFCSQSAWGDMNADDKNYLNNKGFASPVELLKSYRALEKAYSSKISLPKDGDKEALRKLYSHLGMPKDSSGFNLALAEEDKAFGEAFKQVCFENYILPQSAQGLYDWFVKHREAEIEQSEQERINQSFAEFEEQKTAWGDKACRNMELMKRGVRLFAGTDDTVADAIEQALGTKRMMQVFCKLGEAVAEDNPVAFGQSQHKSYDTDMASFFREMFHGL